MISTLAVCSGFFLLGLMSDYIFGRRAADGSWWAQAVYAAVPNWQLFWMGDALAGSRKIAWSTYLTGALGYTAAYVGATLCAALWLFEERELS